MTKLTKQNIEDIAKEIMRGFIARELDEDVRIFFNNKRMKVGREYNKKFEKKPVLVIEEGYSPFEYFDYAAKNHIISISFEGCCADCFGWLSEILKKYDLYYELGNSWNLSVYPNDDDADIEYTFYGTPPKPKYLYRITAETPEELAYIMRTWYILSSRTGDKGTSVLGAGFEFMWNGKLYFMMAQSPHQGNISWETHIEEITKMLRDIGATDIKYDWGRMD